MNPGPAAPAAPRRMNETDLPRDDALGTETECDPTVLRPARPWRLAGPELEVVRDLTSRLHAMGASRADRVAEARVRLERGLLDRDDAYEAVAAMLLGIRRT
jgi:hypothetical protein